MVPYMSVRAHYGTDSLELQEKCVEITYVTDDHTVTELVEELWESAQQ